MPEIQDLLKNVPQDIRQWLGSEKITYLIGAINQKLELEGESQRIIPRLLFRLEVRNLQPQNFVSELSKELNKPLDGLKPIIEEIKKNILLPIDSDLFKWGVDIRQISAGYGSVGWATTNQLNQQKLSINQNPMPITPAMPQIPLTNRVEISPPPQTTATKPAPQQNIPQPQSQPQPTTSQPATFPPQQNTPVMLYQKQEQKPLAASIKAQIKGEMTADTKTEVKQVPARIEIGPEAATLTSGDKKEPIIARTPQSEFPRMVHYSDFKTPVNNQGQAAVPTTPAIVKPETISSPTEEVVDLNIFKPTKPDAPPPSGQPKTEGNTLDLR